MFNTLIEEVGRRLNLKLHTCGKDNVQMATGVDVEGHLGKDGRFYMLDCSRVLPPLKPNREFVNGHLFQVKKNPPRNVKKNFDTKLSKMFRKEFVSNFKLFPLCSDSYSRFIKDQPDKKEHNREIDIATKDLLGPTIAFVANEFYDLMQVEININGNLMNFRLVRKSEIEIYFAFDFGFFFSRLKNFIRME